MDVNTALAGTVAALQNAPEPSKPTLSKEEISTIVVDAVSKENQKLRVEFKSDMSTLKQELIVEAKSYADNIDVELRSALNNLEQVLGQSILVVQKLTRPALPAPESSQPPN